MDKYKVLRSQTASIIYMVKFFVLIILLLFTSGCDAEKTRPCDLRNPCYIKGHGVGYEEAKWEWYNIGLAEGHEKGHKEGYWEGVQAFIEDSWVPTLGLVAMIFLAGLCLIPVMFLLKKIYGYLHLRVKRLRFLYSTIGIGLLKRDQVKLYIDQKKVEERHKQTLDLLKSEIQQKFNLLDKAMRPEIYASFQTLRNQLLEIEGEYILLQDDIRTTADILRSKRQKNYRKTINDIYMHHRIETTDKPQLFEETLNYFKNQN